MNKWYFEQADEPLFPNILWSRPETKSQSGSFVIIGGNTHGFHSVFAAYGEVQSLGVGEIRVALPDSLKKHTSTFFPEALYLPSTPGGTFSKKGFEQLLHLCELSDGILLPGNVENNSETSLLFEQLLASTDLPTAIAKDAFDSLSSCWVEILKRPQTVVELDLKQLQKLAQVAQSETAVTSSFGKQQLVDFLHTFTTDHKLSILIELDEHIMAAHDGKVCVSISKTPVNPMKAGVYASQLPDTFFEALCCSLLET